VEIRDGCVFATTWDAKNSNKTVDRCVGQFRERFSRKHLCTPKGHERAMKDITIAETYTLKRK